MNNIVQVIKKETKKHLKRIAIIDEERILTYAELLAATDTAAKKLKQMGVSRFNRVALLCQDSADYIILSLAALKLGAVIVPVPFGSSPDEINALIGEISINFLIFEQGSYPKECACRVFEKIYLHKFTVNKNQVPKGFYKINPAFIRFSSGTTGTNKGVVLSHKSIMQRTLAANQGLNINPGEQIIWVLSMSFHFVVTILLFLRRGATIIISNRNFPQSLLQNLTRHQATFIYASPLHYHLLASLNIPKSALSRLRLAVSTAVKLPFEIAEKFRQKFGFELAECYGIIEMGLPFANSSADPQKRGSVGKILPGYKIKISNPDKEGVGEILLKGKGMFDAYFCPWQPSRKASPSGWFNTQDLGRLDQDGYLFILGRSKQMINFSGMKIFPFEVESLLNSHPLIKESLVYGKPHPEYGQLAAAKIVLKNSHTAVDPQALKEFCYQHLAAYKVPKEFEFVDTLPKTASGKIIISDIRDIRGHIT
jgi:long-chain acyl-CoA synthetase